MQGYDPIHSEIISNSAGMMNRCSGGVLAIDTILSAVMILYHSISQDGLCRFRSFRSSWYDPSNLLGHTKSFVNNCYHQCEHYRSLIVSSCRYLLYSPAGLSCIWVLCFLSRRFYAVSLKESYKVYLLFRVFRLYPQSALLYFQVLFSCSPFIVLLHSLSYCQAIPVFLAQLSQNYAL